MHNVNLLIYWQYGINTDAFKKFLINMNVTEYTYLYENKEDYIDMDDAYPIYLYNKLDFFSEAKIENELDDEVLKEIAPFERRIMEVVNRWIRSYKPNQKYSSVREVYFILLRYWYDYITKHHINLMVINIMPHIPMEYIPYAICKALNIPTIIQGIIPFTAGEKTNYILQPSVDSFDYNMIKRFEIAQKKYGDNNDLIKLIPEVKRYFEQYDPNEKKEKKVVFYNEDNSLLEKIHQYSNRIKLYLKRKDYAILFNKAKYLTKIKVETGKFLKEVEKMELPPDFNKNYLLFALHLQPEATTLPGGGNFANQLLAIRMIAKYLPDNVMLYIKEHPSYWMDNGRLESVYESRDINFYKNINKLKNVKLIPHTIPSEKLMEKCLGVVTITGTIGFEAIFKGKPVITFGPTFYDIYPYVYSVRTCKDCRKAINSIVNSKYVYSKRLVEILLYATQKYVVTMGMNEKNFLDNGVPPVDDSDRESMVNKLIEFYNEYYGAETRAI